MTAEKKIIEPGRWSCEFDEEGNVSRVVCEPSCRRLLGYETEEEYANTEDSWKSIIHPDDVTRVVEHFAFAMGKHPEGLDYDTEYRMLTKWGYHWFHSYGHCQRREDGSPIRCDGVVFDLQDTVNKKILLNWQDALIHRMAGNEGLFLIDCRKDTRKTIHDYHAVARDFPDNEGYSKGIARYVNTFVAASDRAMMLEATSPAYMLERLGDVDEFAVDFRDFSTNRLRFYEMRVARFSETEVLQSFANKEKEIVDRMILDKLKDDYFAFFGIDLDEGVCLVLKEPPWYKVEGRQGALIPYSSTFKKFASQFAGEARKFFDKISSVDYLRQRFAKDDRATFTYKSPQAGGKWVRVTELVLVRHADGVPSLFALGFSLLDDNAAQKEELQRKIREQFLLLDGLAREYHTVWLIDGNGEHRMRLYRSTGKSTIMDAVQMGLDVAWYDIVIQKYIEEYIYEDDRTRVAEATRFETVVGNTPNVGTYVVPYRRYNSDRSDFNYQEMCFARAVTDDGIVNYVFAFRDVDRRMRKLQEQKPERS